MVAWKMYSTSIRTYSLFARSRFLDAAACVFHCLPGRRSQLRQSRLLSSSSPSPSLSTSPNPAAGVLKLRTIAKRRASATANGVLVEECGREVEIMNQGDRLRECGGCVRSGEYFPPCSLGPSCSRYTFSLHFRFSSACSMLFPSPLPPSPPRN